MIRGELSCAPNARNNRDLDIVVDYEVVGSEATKGQMVYKMYVALLPLLSVSKSTLMLTTGRKSQVLARHRAEHTYINTTDTPMAGDIYLLFDTPHHVYHCTFDDDAPRRVAQYEHCIPRMRASSAQDAARCLDCIHA